MYLEFFFVQVLSSHMRDILYRECVLPDIDEYRSTLLIIDHFHPVEEA